VLRYVYVAFRAGIYKHATVSLIKVNYSQTSHQFGSRRRIK